MADAKKVKADQKDIVTAKYLEQQMTAFQNEINRLRNMANETRRTISALEDLKQFKGKQNSIVPLGAGVFLHSTVDLTKPTLVDMGAGVVVEKEIDEAISILRERLKNIDENVKVLTANLSKMSKQYNSILMKLYQQQA